MQEHDRPRHTPLAHAQTGSPRAGRGRADGAGARRIADASLNRAREALRVLEDTARFALDDRSTVEALKTLRHDLQRVSGALFEDHSDRVLDRDTPGDVGTAISTDAELTRPGLASVVAAAAGRGTEAIRSLEEACKLLAMPDAAAIAESIRYRVYEAERAITLGLARPAPAGWRLCVLITESLCAHHAWDETARLAIEGGADCLQLREKNLPTRQLLDRTRRLLQIADGRAAIVVNDRVDVALAAGADGVHLGQSDMPLSEARRLAGRRLLIGVSCSTIEHAREATGGGADVVGLGPMFPSTTKPKDTLSGPDLLRSVLADPETASIPHLAISGIDAGRAQELAALGCRGVAVSSAVCSEADPARAAAAISAAFGTGA
ncbi:MAG: thiamine phosphate synthase [Planctomycetota bacterium]